MGFREGAWATVWEIKRNPSGKSYNVNMSVSTKNKDTDEYETEWSGFAVFGGDAAKKVTTLKARDRIKLKGCDVKTKYSKEKNEKYTNYFVWDFDMSDFSSGGGKSRKNEQSDEYGIDEDSMPF